MKRKSPASMRSGFFVGARPGNGGQSICTKEAQAMRKKIAFAALAAVAAFALAPANAADVGVAGTFAKGRTHFVVTGGTGNAFDETYLVLGVGVSYFLVDGLSIGLIAESWTGSDPNMYKITPSVQYVFYQAPTVKPYVGAFYRRTFVDDLPNINSVGARGGVYFQVGRNAYFGVGAVYESYLDCSTTVFRSCSDTYPELSLTFAF
jgi:hypothetical protein